MSERLSTQELQTVYQSNEVVPYTGQYALVGDRPPERRVRQSGPLEEYKPVIVHLTKGDIFPIHEGRLVCWRLASIDGTPHYAS